MKFFFYAFIIILTRNSFGGIAIPLAITNAEDDLWGSSPDLSLFSDHELLPGTTTNDVDLFTSATDTTDSSTLLSASINPDAFCPNQLSLETDEGVFFEPSSSEAVEARDPDDGTLDRRAGPTDLQCAQRTKPQAPKKAPNIKVPQLPSLWPQPYPEVPRGQCIDQFRTLATCCTTREGINPADCFLYSNLIGWCDLGFQFCCRDIDMFRQGIDCIPVNWVQPSVASPSDDPFVLPWDLRSLLGN